MQLFAYLVVVVLIGSGWCQYIANNNTMMAEPLSDSPKADLGEGPHFYAEQNALYYVDAFVGDVHRYDFATNVDESASLGDLTTIVIPIEGEADNLLVSLRNKVGKLNWKKKTFEAIAEVAAERNGKERFNDGKIDAMGRLWIGTVLSDKKGVVKGGGSLYKLVNGNFVKMESNFTLSNGMAWNKNNTLMYFNDSEGQKTYVFDFDLKTGTTSNKRTFLDFQDKSNGFGDTELPDGMTIDDEDNIWISLYGGGRIARINPETRKVVTSIPVPAVQTTSLTFGGANFTDIFVTSGASLGDNAGDKKLEHAGKVFKIATNFKGNKAFNFKSNQI